MKIDNLASKVEKHNSMVERAYGLERRMTVLSPVMAVLGGDVDGARGLGGGVR